MNKSNVKLTSEKENCLIEITKLNTIVEKLKQDFQSELADIKYKIHQDEMKRFNDAMSQMDVRVKDIENKKFEFDRKNDEEIARCELNRRNKDKHQDTSRYLVWRLHSHSEPRTG